MARDFDQEFAQDLEFTIGGEKFLMRLVRPEVIASWEDEETPEKSVDALVYTDSKIKLFLDQTNGASERWDELRAREENPVSLGQMNEILRWMVEVQSGYPTPQPAPSAAGRGRTATPSSARSR
jgi:hypothetical protein